MSQMTSISAASFKHSAPDRVSWWLFILATPGRWRTQGRSQNHQQWLSAAGGCVYIVYIWHLWRANVNHLWHSLTRLFGWCLWFNGSEQILTYHTMVGFYVINFVSISGQIESGQLNLVLIYTCTGSCFYTLLAEKWKIYFCFFIQKCCSRTLVLLNNDIADFWLAFDSLFEYQEKCHPGWFLLLLFYNVPFLV